MSDYLTERQQSLVINYVGNGGNILKAALKSKFSDAYSRHDTYKLMPTPKMQDPIKKAKQIQHDDFMFKLGVTMQWRMNKLKRVVNEIIPDHGDIKFRYVHSAIKALAEITSLVGDSAPSKSVSLTVNTTLDKLEGIQRQYKEY